MGEVITNNEAALADTGKVSDDNITNDGASSGFPVPPTTNLAAITDLTFSAGQGKITGADDTDITMESAAGRKIIITAATNLELTAGNQILLNSAGHYIRMGVGFVNLPSDGGVYFCSDTTAATPVAALSRPGAGRIALVGVGAPVSLTVTGGIVTTSAPVLDATQTWNAGGVAFTAIKANVTDTASLAASKLVDLQVGGVSKFSVSKVGNIGALGWLGFLRAPSDGGIAFCSDVLNATPVAYLTQLAADYGSGMTYNYLLEGPRDDANHVGTSLMVASWFDRPLGNRYGCSIASANGRVTIASVAQGPYVGAADLMLYAAGITLIIGAGGTSVAASHTITTDGDLVAKVVGGGLKIKEGVNAMSGVATLVAGAATIATTKVTANSRVYAFAQVAGGTPGFLREDGAARVVGVSFDIVSSDVADTSTVAWLIIEPAP